MGRFFVYFSFSLLISHQRLFMEKLYNTKALFTSKPSDIRQSKSHFLLLPTFSNEWNVWRHTESTYTSIHPILPTLYALFQISFFTNAIVFYIATVGLFTLKKSNHSLFCASFNLFYSTKKKFKDKFCVAKSVLTSLGKFYIYE